MPDQSAQHAASRTSSTRADDRRQRRELEAIRALARRLEELETLLAETESDLRARCFAYRERYALDPLRAP